MPGKVTLNLFSVLCCLALQSAPVVAQELKVKVSVKVVLDENGNRPAEGYYREDAQIEDAILSANQILAFNGADWRLQLVEIVDVDGISQWYGPVSGFPARDGIERAALENPSVYKWRADAINVYVLSEIMDFTGVCSFPD